MLVPKYIDVRKLHAVSHQEWIENLKIVEEIKCEISDTSEDLSRPLVI